MVNDHKFAKGGKVLYVAKGGEVWARKEGQNPEGGLNQKGRDSYNRKTGEQFKAAGISKAGCQEPEGCWSKEKLLFENECNVRSDERRQGSSDTKGLSS
jgi:hypothetical protein